MSIQFAPRWTIPNLLHTCIVGNATDIASSDTSTLLDLKVNNVSKFTVDKFGELIITPTARTSGSGSLIDLIAPADTTRAASTEATDINFNLARTVQFAAGNITDQRAIRIQAPTYSFVSASTITNASTLSISGPPVAGTNATITNRRALHIESGNSLFNGEVRVSSALRFGTYSAFQESSNGFFITYQDQQRAYYSHPTIALSNGFSPGYVWASNVTNSATYYGLYSGTNNVIQFRGGTGSQVIQFFNTFTDASNYERLAFQFGTFSSVRHAQIAAESAGTGTANINLVLTPKGTGAFILGPPPDGTVTGGNARGANAADLQTSRASASQVASGLGAFLCGALGIASGSWSHVSGYGCIVSGAEGGHASGYESSVTGHQSGFAHGNRCVVSGATASSAIGYELDATGNGSHARGLQSRADREAQWAYAGGSFAGRGSAQHTMFVLRNKTTTNAPATLQTGLFAATRLTIPSGKILHATVQIVGSKSDGTAVASYLRQVTIKNVGGTTSLVGTVNTIGTDEAAGTSIAITADDTNDALEIAVTGVTSETWRWVAVVYGVELAYGT